jgi:hypothetical protein
VEPSTIELQSGATGFNRTADHANGYAYSLIYYPGADQLWLQRDGVDLVVLESSFLLDQADSGASLGAWTQDDYLWYSWKDDSDNKALKYRDISGATTVTVGSGGASSEWFGYVQNIRAVGITCFKPHHFVEFGNTEVDQLHIYGDPVDADPPTLLGKVTVPRRLFVPSLRGYNYPGIGNVVGCLYFTAEATKMRIWRLDSLTEWTVIADFTLRGADTEAAFGSETDCQLTVFDHARTKPEEAETVFLAAIENEFAADPGGNLTPLLSVVSSQFIGVVPYADFSGMSVAKALKELALATMSYIHVDHNRIGLFQGRAIRQEERDAPPIDLTEPLERRSRILWEFYRTSVEVRGETADGTAVTATAGEQGASARRQTFSSQFVNSEALAFGVATQYLGYLGQRRREEEVTVREQDPTPHVLDKVRLDGRDYLVAEARHDFLQREIELRLYELEP